MAKSGAQWSHRERDAHEHHGRSNMNAGKDTYPLEIEKTLHGHASGALKPSQVHQAMPSGWSVNLKKGNYEYEVTAPDGKIHYVAP